MSERYEPGDIESKWQKKWEEEGVSATRDDSEKPKYYCLIEFPYPSGEGLHIGHIRSNTAMDIIARKRRMEGYEVLYPIGWDAFGLPTENYAIKTGIHPREVTKANTDNFRRQLKALGFSFDWSREIDTTDPKYYKWTQWIFLKFLEAGLAYKAKQPINWCLSCKIGLANEEVVDGRCERCGGETEKRDREQWMLAITKYADRLCGDLDTVNFLEKIKIQQRNWIGKSSGCEIEFPIKSEGKRRVIIMHGKNSDPSKNWFPWISEQLNTLGYEVIIPDLPDAEDPEKHKWIAVLEDLKPDENTVLIGHSRGGVAIMRYLEQLEGSARVAKVVLVGTNSGNSDKPSRGFFSEAGYDFSAIRKHCDDFAIIHSRDDEWVPFAAAEENAGGLDAKLCIYEDKGHFGKIILKAPEVLREVVPSLSVFTTRADTLYGCTYVVVAPEHPLVRNEISNIKNQKEVEAYLEETKKKSEIERTAEGREKTGVRLEGITAVNPINSEEVPVYVADYVLGDYGTGAVMAVPAHDERDFEFARKYDLPIRSTIAKTFVTTEGNAAVREDLEDKHRRTVIAIVKHWEKDAYLCLDWERFGWHSFIIGGIDDGETPEEAAVRETQEETGYRNFHVKGEVGFEVHNRYFAAHKGINRYAETRCVLLELENDEQEPIEEEHTVNHVPVWKDASELNAFLNLPAHEWYLSIVRDGESAMTEDGALYDSGEFSGFSSAAARERIAEKLESEGQGKRTITYKLRDWVFSRQRYWGEPIPVVHCETCGVVPVPESELPVELPDIEGGYQPTDTGESPLAEVEAWVNTTCPACGAPAKRETDTMPNWAGSSWYFLRYIDPENDEALADPEKLRRFMPVDWYNGGMEHTTLHLLYSRFWNKFLYDQGVVPVSEPYAKRTSHGLILAEGGVKMSKSKGNVVNPDDIVRDFGADALRLYEMFMGPFDQHIVWDEHGVVGTRRFLDRVFRLSERVTNEAEDSHTLLSALHGAIAKVGEDIEAMRFNTAVSTMMSLVNVMEKEKAMHVDSFGSFLRILSPFAPHIAEELWERIGNTESIFFSEWPEADPALLVADTVTIVVQVNGKLRESFEVPANISEEALKTKALESEKVKPYLDGQEPKRIIVVPGRLVNVVV